MIEKIGILYYSRGKVNNPHNFRSDNMKKAELNKLCELVRNMEFIQSFSFERKYCVNKDFNRCDVTIILSPKTCYIGEERLKIVFYNSTDIKTDSDLYNLYFKPIITIQDISSYGWEECNFSVEEIENTFSLKCEDINYELLPPVELE